MANIRRLEDINQKGQLEDFCIYVIRGPVGLSQDLLDDPLGGEIDDWLEGKEDETIEYWAREHLDKFDFDGEWTIGDLRSELEQCPAIREMWAQDWVDEHPAHAGSGIFAEELETVGPNEWIVHFTPECPSTVLKAGWEGVSPETCGLTKWGHGAQQRETGSLGFGYLASENPDGSGYGDNYILCKAPAVLAFHETDCEQQVVFDVSEYTIAIPVESDTIEASKILPSIDKSDRKAFKASFDAAAREMEIGNDDEDDVQESVTVGNCVEAIEFIENVFSGSLRDYIEYKHE